METVRRKIKNLFESSIFFYLLESFYGFAMAVATFHVFPLAVEVSGLFVAFFGVLSGGFTAYILKKILSRTLATITETASYFWIVVSVLVLLAFHTAKFPFCTYTANGLYLGALAGILLFVQFYNLSKKQQIKSGIWYLFGLVLGILLK